jgi:hypothetical protein
MKRINQYDFYNLGTILTPLSQIKEGSALMDMFVPLFQAKTALEGLLKGQPLDFVVCKGEITALQSAISDAMQSPKEGSTQEEVQAHWKRTLNSYEAWRITNALQRFETVAAAELQTLDSYFISKKGIYSTADLIEHAERALSDDVRSLMPTQAVSDFRQAGKCLAFDLFTAAGFHTLRATDSVIRSYYARFVGQLPAPKLRNWAAYIRVLKRCIDNPPLTIKPDIKTLELIDHIRDMHRNPIIHPEDNLDEDKALILFDLCKSAIVAMVTEIKEARQIAVNALAKAGAPSLLAHKVKVVK